MNMHRDKSQLLQSISVLHNSNFSYEDVQSVLEPLFGNYYGPEQLRSIISNTNHIWCVYHRSMRHYVASALAQSQPTDNILYVKLFGVAQLSQGQGIGTRLLKTIIKWAQRENYLAIVLHTQIDNTRAIAFYENVGFRKQHYTKNFFNRRGSLAILQSFQPDAYRMILFL